MSKIKVELKYRLNGGTRNAKWGIYYIPQYEIIETCCKEFSLACDAHHIGFDTEIYTTTNFGFNIMKSDNYPGDYNEYFRPINFCPFCGEKIEIKLEIIHSEITKKIKKHMDRKTIFLKGLNMLLIIILIHGLNDRVKDSKFIYKYGLNKIKWI